LKSYQNLVLLQNLYRLQSIGFNYIDHFNVNEKKSYEEASSFNELQENIKSCHLCDLSKSRKQSMPGFGNVNANLMVVDYTVSQAQDSANSYYSGRSGEMLKSMIENVLQLNINETYLTHLVKCKPLKSNRPSPSECNSCKAYLLAQIDFIKPKVVMVLGADAYMEITQDSNFENVRGHVIDFKEYKLIPIYHPQHLLRNPELKKITMNDLKTVKTSLYTQKKV